MPDMDELDDEYNAHLFQDEPPTEDEVAVRWHLADYCRRCAKLCRGNPHSRYYCPLCHHVTCGVKRQGEWIVLPHYEKSARERAYRNDEYAVESKPCRGGPVDEREDRAP